VAMLVSREVAIASRLGVEVSVLFIVLWSLSFCYPFSLAEAASDISGCDCCWRM